MLRKIIRALLGKEEYELDVKIGIGLVDLIFVLAFLVAIIWVLLII